MAIKYVDPLGTDSSGYGTSAGAGAFKTVQYALASGGLAAGDTLFLAANAYESSAIFGISVSGTGTLYISGVGAVSFGPSAAFAGATRFFGGIPSAITLDFTNVDLINPHAISINLFASIGQALKCKFHGCDINWGGVGKDTFLLSNGAGQVDLLFDGGCHLQNNVINNGIAFVNAQNSTTKPNITCTGCEISHVHKFFLDYSPANWVFEDNHAHDCVGTAGILVIAKNTSTWSIRRNKFVMSAENNSMLWFSSEASQYYNANPNENYDINWNVFYTDAAITAATLTNAMQSSYYRLPLQDTNYWLGPESANAALVLSEQRPVVSLADSIGVVGDSIANGATATTGNRWFEIFTGLTGKSLHVNDEYTTLGGLRTEGCFWQIDRIMEQYAPKTLIVFIGINNINGATRQPANATNDDVIDSIMMAVNKARLYGCEVIYIAPSSVTGGNGSTTPPDNTALVYITDGVLAECETLSVPAISIYEHMLVENAANYYKPSASGGYYEAIATDVHPNNSGHALIGRVVDAVYRFATTGIKFGLSAALTAPLPLSAQPCKDHALPIGTGKITVFPGVASAAQINEAKE